LVLNAVCTLNANERFGLPPSAHNKAREMTKKLEQFHFL